MFNRDIRHVDVAILYGLGMKDRAHLLAKRLRPSMPPGFAVSSTSTSEGIQLDSDTENSVTLNTIEEY